MLLQARQYCKICALFGISSKDINDDLDTVYGDNALAYLTVIKWIHLFKKCRTEVKDDPRAGRPLSAKEPLML